MIKTISKLFILSLILSTLYPSLASAAKPTGPTTTKTPLGNDISWPQCGSRNLPTTQAFGIVGLNGGLANNTNPCFAQQMQWANKSVGGTTQEKVQIYVNTANPGGLGTESWPSNNIDPAGNTTNNPYDTCDNSDSLACAWQYGWNRAVEDVQTRFKPTIATTTLNQDPAHYIWWLDVETVNSWKLTNTTFDHQSNVAVLEAMTAYFKSQNIRVGLYSTNYQWGQIAGDQVLTGSVLNGLPNWYPVGKVSLDTAKNACNYTAFTSGSTIVLTQFVSKNLDYNYSCVN